jgi:hypothetical protein
LLSLPSSERSTTEIRSLGDAAAVAVVGVAVAVVDGVGVPAAGTGVVLVCVVAAGATDGVVDVVVVDVGVVDVDTVAAGAVVARSCSTDAPALPRPNRATASARPPAKVRTSAPFVAIDFHPCMTEITPLR